MVDLLLGFDETLCRISLCFDESAIESTVIDQGKQGTSATGQFPLDIAVPIGIGQGKMMEEVIQMEYENFDHAGYGLPHPYPVIQGQFGDGEPFLTVSGVVKKVFEVVLVSGDVYDGCIRWKVFYDRDFVGVHPNAGKETPEKKRR